MLVFALESLFRIFVQIYLVSGVLYFAHCVLVWKRWSWAKQQPAPWWIRCNMSWALAGNGYFTLTNGRIVVHTITAVVPIVNTALLATQMGYLVADTLHRIWKRHASPWWTREAPMRAPKA